MPYNGILLSDAIGDFIPYLKGVPYIMHSPTESLETYEMESILATRGAVMTNQGEVPKLVLIHRLFLPCLNYIPGLTDCKRHGAVDFLLFGTYLDYDTVDDAVQPTCGSGIHKIFPSSGIICFTITHVLEAPLHIRQILAYRVRLESLRSDSRVHVRPGRLSYRSIWLIDYVTLKGQELGAMFSLRWPKFGRSCLLERS
jgi:hypothetical protein